jgi:NADPH2:quinone reductase
MTSKTTADQYLSDLGAAQIINLPEQELGTRPLETARWAGAVDNLGGDVLAWLTRTTQPYGNIASIGLVAGVELNTTVMPFILRGISLLGINSVEVPRDLRIKVWNRIAGDLAPAHLDLIASHEVALEDLDGCFQAYIDGRVTGRTVVRLA